MRLFRRTARPSAPVRIEPEFGVQLTLRRGDRIVRRDARGAIHITQVTEERVELTDLDGIGARPRKVPRRG